MLAVSIGLERVVSVAAAKLDGDGPSEQVALADAEGRVIADDFYAGWHVPRVRTSIKDGYAVKSGFVNGMETGHVFEVAGKMFAGDGQLVKESSFPVYVTTGSAIPKGYDAVVEVERTSRLKDGILIQARDLCPGQDIREIGSDIKEGVLLIRKGQVLDCSSVGVLAMFGMHLVLVFKQPTVGVMSTGDELVDCNGTDTPAYGNIYDANRPMLIASASKVLGSSKTVHDLGIMADMDAKVESVDDTWLDRVLESNMDVLITSGGVSMGERDFVRTCLERRGEIHIERLFMKPGKPLVFATVPRTDGGSLLVFALPGNPVSSVVTFHLVVEPCLRVLLGWREPRHERIMCRLAHDLTIDPVRPEYHRVELSTDNNGSLLANSTGFQRSSALGSMLGATALLELPNRQQNGGSSVVHKGSVLPCILIGQLKCRHQPQRKENGPTCSVISIKKDALGDQVCRDIEQFLQTELGCKLESTRETKNVQALVQLTENMSSKVVVVLEFGGSTLKNEAGDALEALGYRRLVGLEEAMRTCTFEQSISEDRVLVSRDGRRIMFCLAQNMEHCQVAITKLGCVWKAVKAISC
mmetsp:Transcript_15187/g.26800  ORF Transcript_15187/g.26800 Transcript_15187/m.26800 type:complete len:583 (+) Transcript_15187:97-1845(+)